MLALTPLDEDGLTATFGLP